MKDIHLIELEFSLNEAKKLSATRVNILSLMRMAVIQFSTQNGMHM